MTKSVIEHDNEWRRFEFEQKVKSKMISYATDGIYIYLTGPYGILDSSGMCRKQGNNNYNNKNNQQT